MHAYTSVPNVGAVSTEKLGTLRDGAKSELAQRIAHYTPELAQKSEYSNHGEQVAERRISRLRRTFRPAMTTLMPFVKRFASSWKTNTWRSRPSAAPCKLTTCANDLFQLPRQHEHQHRLPVDRDLVARIGSLLVRIDFCGRRIRRKLLQDVVLLTSVWSSREQPGPRLWIVVGAARTMMRMPVRIGAQLRHPGERKCISSQQDSGGYRVPCSRTPDSAKTHSPPGAAYRSSPRHRSIPRRSPWSAGLRDRDSSRFLPPPAALLP